MADPALIVGERIRAPDDRGDALRNSGRGGRRCNFCGEPFDFSLQGLHGKESIKEGRTSKLGQMFLANDRRPTTVLVSCQRPTTF